MTRWYKEKKREHFYKEAKRTGYRARSAFKLKEIHQKFHLLGKDCLVVDLGAAPGGWSQVAQEFVGEHGIVIGADISAIRPLGNIHFIQGDITEKHTIEQIIEQMNGQKADVVISDMSPDISGNYSVDQARSAWLSECALTAAAALLKPGGNFVCKIFEGEETKKFLEMVQQRFNIVKKFSPEATRKSSSEIYIIAKSFRK